MDDYGIPTITRFTLGTYFIQNLCDSGFGNLNAGSVTSFGSMISFKDTFSASSSDKTWNLILRLKTRRILRNMESFVGGRVREGDYRLFKRTE
uniref:Uncharacterized protein n=1 Tax=Tanacetum cinerariifolium TaxID=118510 RepID=A0A699RI86_TANCI|nr:hypothetical protein [Tanacetum cinerariifolium]